MNDSDEEEMNTKGGDGGEVKSPKEYDYVRGQFSIHFSRLQEEQRIREHNKEIDRQLLIKLKEGKAKQLAAWANMKNNKCDDGDNDDDDGDEEEN